MSLCRSSAVYGHHVSWEDRSDKINHQGPDLVWRQIVSDIEAMVASGELGSGHRLPPEDELAGLYGVSRGTIRRALTQLVEDGLVTRVHGRGTFIV